MTKKLSRIIATVMLLLLAVFLWCAATYPEWILPWVSAVASNLYRIYIGVMVVLFIAPFPDASE